MVVTSGDTLWTNLDRGLTTLDGKKMKIIHTADLRISTEKIYKLPKTKTKHPNELWLSLVEDQGSPQLMQTRRPNCAQCLPEPGNTAASKIIKKTTTTTYILSIKYLHKMHPRQYHSSQDQEEEMDVTTHLICRVQEKAWTQCTKCIKRTKCLSTMVKYFMLSWTDWQ